MRSSFDAGRRYQDELGLLGLSPYAGLDEFEQVAQELSDGELEPKTRKAINVLAFAYGRGELPVAWRGPILGSTDWLSHQILSGGGALRTATWMATGHVLPVATPLARVGFPPRVPCMLFLNLRTWVLDVWLTAGDKSNHSLAECWGKLVEFGGQHLPGLSAAQARLEESLRPLTSAALAVNVEFAEKGTFIPKLYVKIPVKLPVEGLSKLPSRNVLSRSLWPELKTVFRQIGDDLLGAVRWQDVTLGMYLGALTALRWNFSSPVSAQTSFFGILSVSCTAGNMRRLTTADAPDSSGSGRESRFRQFWEVVTPKFVAISSIKLATHEPVRLTPLLEVEDCGPTWTKLLPLPYPADTLASVFRN